MNVVEENNPALLLDNAIPMLDVMKRALENLDKELKSSGHKDILVGITRASIGNSDVSFVVTIQRKI